MVDNKLGFPWVLRPFINESLIRKFVDADYESIKDAVVAYLLFKGFMVVIFFLVVFWLFNLQYQFNSLILLGLITILVIICFFSIDLLVRADIRDQQRKREQFLPMFLYLLNIYYKSGASLDESLRLLALEINRFYLSFARRLTRAHFALILEPNRAQGYISVADLIGVPIFKTAVQRIQVREQHGYKMSEAINHAATQIEKEINYKANLYDQKIPAYIMFISIFCFLGSLIIILGSTILLKVFDTLAQASSMVG